MQATRQEIVTLAENLGYKTAGKWNKARMEEKLLTIAQLDPDGEEIAGLEDDDQKKLFAMIVKNKGVVEIVKESADKNTTAESEGATEEESKSKSKSKSKSATKDESSDGKTAEQLNAEINKVVPDGKKKPQPKPRSMSRLEAAFLTVKNATDKTNATQLIEAANKLYVKNGGSDNLKESKWATTIAMTAGVCFGLISVTGGTVSPVTAE
jgi:seryl-tRNA synthetase